jgi:hypothetical protein
MRTTNQYALTRFDRDGNPVDVECQFSADVSGEGEDVAVAELEVVALTAFDGDVELSKRERVDAECFLVEQYERRAA